MRTLRIDPAAQEPPFEQLKQQIFSQITDGDLPQGTKLPAVRLLATNLGISPGTVARAYRELEISGFLITKGRGGTLVASKDPEQLHEPARVVSVEFSELEYENLVEKARAEGVDIPSAIRASVREWLRA